MDCSTPGWPVLHHLPEFAQTHVHRVGDAIQPSHPPSSLLLPPSIFPRIRIFSSESALCIRWPAYWSFSFSISPSNEHPGLFSFRVNWLDLLAVQGTLKSLPQHHSSKASILQCSVLLRATLKGRFCDAEAGLPAQGHTTRWRSWVWHPGTVDPVTRHTVGPPAVSPPSIQEPRELWNSAKLTSAWRRCVYTAVCFILTLL